MEKGLFSVIILHYNQPDYYKFALDSLFEQTYSKIQLIFADDCSTRINKDEIREYVAKNKKENIVDVVFRFSEKNQGTVKNLNGAMHDVTGEYLSFFAADDALFDKNTIVNYVKSFEEADDRLMVTSQCCMYDEDLEEELSKFVDSSYGELSNKMSSEEQYREMAQYCRFAIGATAFRMSTFEKYGLFDEQYVFVEDWSYWLCYLRNGGHIHYSDFGGLKHRDGGISHNNKKELPAHVKKYMLDMLRIRENEVLPYMKRFPLYIQQEIMHTYDWERIRYANQVGSSDRPSRYQIYSNAPLLFFYIRIKRLVKNVQAISNKVFVKILAKESLAWLLFALLNVFLNTVGLSDSVGDVALKEIVYGASQIICPLIVAGTILFIVGVYITKLISWFRNFKLTYFCKTM